MKNSIGISLLTLVLLLESCHSGKSQSGADSATMKSFGNNSNSNILLGAGDNTASGPFSELLTEYAVKSGIMVNYQLIGGLAGLAQLQKKAVDFCILATPLSDDQQKKLGGAVLQVQIFTAPGADNTSRGTWIFIYKEQNYDGRNLMRAQKLLKMFWWDIHEGQQFGKTDKLSPAAIIDAERLLKSATFDGKPILE